MRQNNPETTDLARNRLRNQRWRRIGLHLMLIAGTVIMLLPFVWMLSTSFKHLEDIFGYPPALIPSNPTLDNYVNIFEDADMLRVLFNTFLVHKKRTMHVKGGNTPIYQGDGRLRMSRSLERLWPGVVATKRRWLRPQHVISHSWTKFDTPLKLREGVDLEELGSDEYGMKLKMVRDTDSNETRKVFEELGGETVP